jgi:hypothetical protein
VYVARDEYPHDSTPERRQYVTLLTAKRRHQWGVSQTAVCAIGEATAGQAAPSRDGSRLTTRRVFMVPAFITIGELRDSIPHARLHLPELTPGLMSTRLAGLFPQILSAPQHWADKMR